MVQTETFSVHELNCAIGSLYEISCLCYEVMVINLRKEWVKTWRTAPGFSSTYTIQPNKLKFLHNLDSESR